VKYWKAGLPTISRKPVGVRATFQRLIPTGEQSGLLTHIAATESVSLCARMKADGVSGTGIGDSLLAASLFDKQARFFAHSPPMKTTVILAFLSLIYIRLLPQAQAANISNPADGQLVRPAELDQEASGTGRQETHKIARLRNEIIALDASLITYMSQAESSIGNDVELLHASILAANLETVDTAAAYIEAKSLIADFDTLRQHAIADLTLLSDYTAPDVPPTALAGASTTDPETVLASTYQDFNITFRDLSVIIGARALDVQKKLEALAAKSEAINVTETIEIQMSANHLSQVSEMATSIMSAAKTSISSIARNL